MEIRELLCYSDNCRGVMREVLQENVELWTATFETTSVYKSIAALTAHCIGAEERWLKMRLQKESLPVFYEARAGEKSVEEVFSDWDILRQETTAYWMGCSESRQQKVASYQMPQWGCEVELSMEQVFFHIIHHENYHRGQVIMALQRFGVDPPNFDYIFHLG